MRQVSPTRTQRAWERHLLLRPARPQHREGWIGRPLTDGALGHAPLTPQNLDERKAHMSLHWVGSTAMRTSLATRWATLPNNAALCVVTSHSREQGGTVAVTVGLHGQRTPMPIPEKWVTQREEPPVHSGGIRPRTVSRYIAPSYDRS